MPSTTKAIRKLIARIRREPTDNDAWDKMHEAYGPRIRANMFRQTGDRDVAEDGAQVVWGVIVRKLPEYEEREGIKFRGWLNAIVFRAAKEIKRSFRRTPKPIDPSGDVMGQVTRDEGEPRGELFGEVGAARFDTDTEVGRLLESARRHFGSRTFDVFYQTFLREEPVGEVAARCGISPERVYEMRGRVMAWLKAEGKRRGAVDAG